MTYSPSIPEKYRIVYKNSIYTQLKFLFKLIEECKFHINFQVSGKNIDDLCSKIGGCKDPFDGLIKLQKHLGDDPESYIFGVVVIQF